MKAITSALLRLFSLALMTVSLGARGDTWSAVGNGMNSGDVVYALTADNVHNTLYIGGSFGRLYGSFADYVAQWNGTSLSAVGAGDNTLNNTVYALALYNGALHAGGLFNFAGWTQTGGMAVWSGSQWQSITGTGMSQVYALAIYNGELYAGGFFNSAGGNAATNIARWNGVTWSPVGIGMARNSQSWVTSLAVYNGKLYVSGTFTNAGGVTASGIAMWNGSTWAAAGSSVLEPYRSVGALAVYNGELYAVGDFSRVAGTAAESIARWNGTRWAAVGDGLNNTSEALAAYNGELYATGWFTYAGNTNAYYIARWNGTRWAALGAGLNYRAYALAVMNGDLYVGGGFDVAGNIPAMRIAKWHADPSGPPVITSQPASQIVRAGSTASFTVSAVGSTPMSYRWRKNGTTIAGATASRYTISNVQSANTGSYSVVVSNALGSATSGTAVLSLCSYTLSSSSIFLSANGGTVGPISVTTSGGCSWSVTNPATWITITSAINSTGNGSVSFTVAANPSPFARTATLIIAGKPFVVAQGPQFAPANIRGKTLVMNVASGSGSLPATGKYLVDAQSGTTNRLQIVPLSGAVIATNSLYTFTRTSATVASFIYDAITTTLTFTNPVSGTFSVTKSGGQQTGSFVMENKSPDFDANGRYDLTWQAAASRVLSTWVMSATNYSRALSLRNGIAAPTGWSAAGSADFNNDGQSDILFQTSTGSLSLWLMNRTNWMKDVLLRGGLSAGTAWKAVSAADVNGDSQPDVLFQNTDGRLMLWTFNATNYAAAINLRNGLSAGAGWRALATGDFNGDRQTDLVFQQDSGAVALWLMNGINFVTSVGVYNAPAIASTWRVAGAGDFNEDGRTDIFLQNNDGKMMVWLMNGRICTGTVLLRYGQAFSYGLKCVGPK